MDYIKPFEIFESHLMNKEPEWFYLVLRASIDKTATWESLSTMEMNGLMGISDTKKIIEHWLDVRPIMLMMPAKETIELNNIYPIDYYNPDQLVSNNLFLLRRLCDNFNKGSIDGRRMIKYEYTSTLTKIFQRNTLAIGKRKMAKLSGTWHREPTHKIESQILDSFKRSDFYYKINDFIADKIVDDNYTINSVKDLADLIGEGITELGEKMSTIKYGSNSRPLEWIVKYHKEHGTYLFEKVLNWLIVDLSQNWVKSESEWIIREDELTSERSFKIPNNSHLIIKTFPGHDNEEEFNKWYEKKARMKKGKERTYDSEGIEIKEAKELIELYHLENMYNIHLVDNRFEAMELVQKLNNI